MPSIPFNGIAVEYAPIDTLIPYDNNARTHSKKQLQQIAVSIKQFGFINPILIDHAGTIVAGHGRVLAGKSIGMTSVPTIRLEHLTPDQVRAYIIADNRLAEKAGWDNDILAIELQHLSLVTDFDLTLTGFEMPEIDVILQEVKSKKELEEKTELDVTGPAVCKPGDVWELGNHLVLCGDALNPNSYKTLLAGEKVQLVFCDPPYNVPISGHVSGLGKAEHAEFAMASGEMTPDEFTAFLATAIQQWVAHSSDGSIHYICMDWRHMRELLDAAGKHYSELKNVCVWNKTNAGMGSLYRSKHELVFVFKNGTAPHVNNVELGKHGRYRTNVWDYAGQTSMHKDRDDELAMHPTVKPVKLVEDALLDCSGRNAIVLDAFGGSGTTLLAAEATGRQARLIEIDPAYVDVTIRRWQVVTGEQAVFANTGETFDAMEARTKEETYA